MFSSSIKEVKSQMQRSSVHSRLQRKQRPFVWHDDAIASFTPRRYPSEFHLHQSRKGSNRMSWICLQCKLGMVLVVGWKCGAAFLLQSPQNHSMRNLGAESLHCREWSMWMIRRVLTRVSLSLSLNSRAPGYHKRYLTKAGVGWVQLRAHQRAPSSTVRA